MMRKYGWLLLCIIMLFSVLIGCRSSNTGADGSTTTTGDTQQNQSEIKQEIVIPTIYTSGGNDSNTVLNETLIKGFNEEYKGQYRIEVEWLPGVAEDYRSKLKMLNASNDLPAILNNIGAEPAFVELLIRNNRLVDLKPYLDAAPEWKDVCIPETIEDFTTEDGKIFLTPLELAPFVGVYYNKEHFEQAGIDKFPTSWEEFWIACDKLKEAGFSPISLHTTETGWATMILSTSYMASSADGRAFMDEQFPENYDNEALKTSLEIAVKLFSYSTNDAVGGNYALAANNFASGNTSMIANGPWMMSSLGDTNFSPEGFEDIVGYAAMPGNVMLSSPELHARAVTVDHSEEVQQGAIEYLKYRARQDNLILRSKSTGEFSIAVPLPQEDYDELSNPMKDYADAVSNLETVFPIYQTRWDPITQNEVIPSELPNLIEGRITIDEFIVKMNEAAKQYLENN